MSYATNKSKLHKGGIIISANEKQIERKLFIFDFETVLIDSNLNLKKDVLKKIKDIHSKKHCIVLTSNKSSVFLAKYLEDLKLYIDYFVGLNGSILFDYLNGNKLRIQKTFQRSLIKDILKDVKEIGGSAIVHTSRSSFFNNYSYNKNFNLENNTLINYEQYSLKLHSNLFVLQITVDVPNNKEEYFRNYIQEFYGRNLWCSEIQQTSFDINIAGVSKYKSVWKILKLEKISPKSVYVFSSDKNDVVLLESFKNSYTTADSYDNVKKVAKKVISNKNQETISFELTTILEME